MKTIVTGGAGFIGLNFCIYWSKKYKNNNRGLKGSVKNLNIEYEYGSFEKFGDKKR